MKPVKLKFSGINSYRTPQLIDFEQLGRDGLFGIFGPTGSGKSSILDAITLALYGGVERASNNTRGIIHQLENTLEVAFEFQLGSERYLVERRYERNPKDPESAVAKQARIRRLDPQREEVLASKPQEVSTKIEEILGIGRAEFSRAVVLPQGKFDQFLRLTGSDRAAMLEHLFNLEQFGESLVAKVKNQAAIYSEQLQRIAGEESGLGDCSPEIATQAAAILTAKNNEYLATKKTLEEVDKVYQEALTLRNLYNKQKVASQKQAGLEQQRGIIGEKQLLLDRAEKAESFRELLTRQKELQEKIRMEEADCQKNKQLHTEMVTQYETVKLNLAVAEQAFNVELPKLQAQKVLYQGAADKERRIHDLQQSMLEKRKELEENAVRIKTIEKEIQSAQNQLVNMRATLATLQTNRAKFVVNPDERETISRALEVLQHLEENEKRFQEQKANYFSRKVKNEGRWTELDGKIREMLPQQEISPENDIEKLTHALSIQAERELENIRAQYQQAFIMNSAAELVKELHEGEPCPVCGSRLHPQPAEAIREVARLETEVKGAELRLKDLQRWEGQVLTIWRDWAINEPLLREARDEFGQTQKGLDAVRADFEKIRGSWDPEGLRRRKQQFIEFDKQLQQFDQRRDHLLKTQEDGNGKLLELNGTLQEVQSKDAAGQEVLKNCNRQITEIHGELETITGGQDVKVLLQKTDQAILLLQKTLETNKSQETEARSAMERLAHERSGLEATLQANREEFGAIEQRLHLGLQDAGFATFQEVATGLLSSADRLEVRKQLETYRQEVAVALSELDNLAREIAGRIFDETVFGQVEKRRQQLSETLERIKAELTLAKSKFEEIQKKQERWNGLQSQKALAEKRKSLAENLGNLLRGRKFVSFLAQEHLRDMTLEASYQLGRLTGQRYALELTPDKDCEFVIRDDFNGGNRRTINSLSGGEIFMTSLALALALSSKIQLRGRYPLGFFFLDEGFGTLDEEKLDKVMNALEKLHDKNRIVGIISHVQELKERLPRFLEVVSSGEDGSGSTIREGKGY